jgi:hypothetical protein
MIDEPRIVSVHRGVDHDPIVDRKQERMMPPAILGIPCIGFGRRQPLAGVFDQPRAGGNERSEELPICD